MKKVDGYICDHCAAAGKPKRILASASGCARHEKGCYHNPARRACATCALCVKDADEETRPGTVWGVVYSCGEGHDQEMLCGMVFPAAPQHDCEHWKLRIEHDQV